MNRKVWRRIIPFGLSGTDHSKGGRRSIPVGLPYVRRKSLQLREPRVIGTAPMMEKFSTDNGQTNRNISTHQFEWLVEDSPNGIIRRQHLNYFSNSWHKTQACV